MALSNEDKKDVSRAFGKKAASAVSSATRDYATAPASKASKFRGKHSTGSNFNAKTAYENLSRYRRMSGDSSKSKALKSKTSGKWEDPGIQAMKRGVSFGDPR